MNYFSALIFLPALLLSSVGLQAAAVPDVARRDPGPAPSNQKQVDAGGLPVVGSTNVSDFAKAPRFRWRKEPVPENPRVLIQTAMGEIEVGLDRNRAPVSVTNFLHYVHEGLYSDGGFHRTVTLANQAASAVKIQVIQAAANSAKSNEFLPPIQIERTRDTGLKHLEGTISMARAEPDSGQHNFFICIGDQPELDFGGKRNPDGQGFAAFGKVTKGMDVVRRIQGAPAEGQALTPMIQIQRAVRLN